MRMTILSLGMVSAASALLGQVPPRLQFEGATVYSPTILNNNGLTFFGNPYGTTGPTPVPEPSTIGFLPVALALIGLVGRRVRLL